MPTHKKNTLLKNAQANAASNFFKRVFFSPPQEKFLPTPLFLIQLFSQRTGFVLNQTDIALNVNRFYKPFCKLGTTHLRADRRATANKGFAIAGVPCPPERICSIRACSADSFVQGGSSVLRMKPACLPAGLVLINPAIANPRSVMGILNSPDN